MQIEQDEINYEQQYQISNFVPKSNLLKDLFMASTTDSFIQVISLVKQQNDKTNNFFQTLKNQLKKSRTPQINRKNQKNSKNELLKTFYKNITKSFQDFIMCQNVQNSLKLTNLIWFVNNLIIIDEQSYESVKQVQQSIFTTFTKIKKYDNFLSILGLIRKILSLFFKQHFGSYTEILHNLYYEKYNKLVQETSLQFSETFQNLDQQEKLIIKSQIIYLFIGNKSKIIVEQSEFSNIIKVLSEKPYKKLFQHLISKGIKPIKSLKLAILKTKLEITQNKIEYVFGSKIDLCSQLKTKETFILTAKHSSIISEIQSQSLICHGDYVYSKWTDEILIAAKQKITFAHENEEKAHEVFQRFFLYLKKLFEHRHKKFNFINEENKIIQEKLICHDSAFINFCHGFELFVRFFNSLQLNHRSNNLNETISIEFLQDLSQSLSQFYQHYQSQKSLINFNQTIDDMMTFVAHLFYRRDFQNIASYTSKISQNLAKILLKLPSFPLKWNVLRNYKLVIDRWGQIVDDNSQQYKIIAAKFLQAYFNQKVLVTSKSSSTVFNPIFNSRSYCKIFGAQLFKFVEKLQNDLDRYAQDIQSTTVLNQFNSVISKIIIFMSGRLRLSDSNKIAESLSNIYRKYAHLVPEIYIFRVWIMQANVSRIPSNELQIKMVQSASIFKQFRQVIQKIQIKKLLSRQSEYPADFNKILLSYQNLHYSLLNNLQMKSKNNDYSAQIYQALFQLTQQHINIVKQLQEKQRQFARLCPQEQRLISDQNDLFADNSVFEVIKSVQRNLKFIFRYYICNADKLLTTKEYTCIVRLLGEWLIQPILKLQGQKKTARLLSKLNQFNDMIGYKDNNINKSHLMKKQILGAIRSINGTDQVNLTKPSEIPFNQVSSLYDTIKEVYPQLVKLLIDTKKQPQHEDNNKINDNNKNDSIKFILTSIILPRTNTSAACFFNGTIQSKATQQMVFGIFWKQLQSLFNQLSVDQLINLHKIIDLKKVLEITKNKADKINDSKNQRNRNDNSNNIFNQGSHNNGGNIFNRNGGNRDPRRMTQAMQQLRSVQIPQQYIQIAFENIQVPDAQIALQWIQNHRLRIDQMIFQKTMLQSKQVQTKPNRRIQKQGKQLVKLKYQHFIENIQENMKAVIKNLNKQLFSQNGKNVMQLMFVMLDSYKQEFKKKQYLNISKKMFEQINALNAHNTFDHNKYRTILYVLNYTIKKETNLVNQFYKNSINLKILSFVKHFTNLKQSQQDFKCLFQILNTTLPVWNNKQDSKKPQTIKYLNCLLDVIQYSKISTVDSWKIMYKIGGSYDENLRKKNIKLFSILIKISQDKTKCFLQCGGLFSSTKQSYILPLATLFLENYSLTNQSNIQLQIKGYLVENYKQDIQKLIKQNKQSKVLKVDFKRFCSGFEKFVGCKQFQDVFKRLFIKRKNNKNFLYYDIQKHNLFKCDKTAQSFLTQQYDQDTIIVLKSMIERMVTQQKSQNQQEYLSQLLKLLDSFKILIPTAIRINVQGFSLLEWLLTKSIAKTKKRYQLILFLTMKNRLLIDYETQISDYTCYQLLRIIREQLQRQKQNQQRIQILLHLIYLLQVNTINHLCFMPMRTPFVQYLQKCLISISISTSPIQYFLLSQCLYILKKRQMIDYLKQDYQIVDNQLGNNVYEKQFLNMALIYKVQTLENTPKVRRVIMGSRRLLNIEEEDDDQFIHDDDQQDQSQEHDTISHLLRARLQHAHRIPIDNQHQGLLMLPLQSNILQLQGSIPLQPRSIPLQGESFTLQGGIIALQEKMQQQIKESDKKMIIEQSSFNLKQYYIDESIKLKQKLEIIQNLLPSIKQVAYGSLSNKMQIQIQESLCSQVLNIFSQQLSLIIKVSSCTQITSQTGQFSQLKYPSIKIQIQLNDGIKKLQKFERRFKNIITTIKTEIKFDNQIRLNNVSNGRTNLGRRLSQRLSMMGNSAHRDQMITHIQRLLNQNYNIQRQPTRPRLLNLHQAYQQLPEQPQPVKVQQKKQIIIQPHDIQEEKSSRIEQIKNEQKAVQQIQKMQIEEYANNILIQQPEQSVPSQQVQQIEIINQQLPLIPQVIEAPIINQIVQNGPHRQILEMFGLSQSFLADNGIDPQSFDQLPQEFQIDQITHYMNQAQNRATNNNQPGQQNQQRENQQANQAQSGQQSVIQQNIALFASMDPDTRAQMLSQYPPQFLLQLPAQMRTQVQVFRQRQVHRIVQAQRQDYAQRNTHQNVSHQKRSKPARKNLIFPSVALLTFNQIDEKVARQLAQCLLIKIPHLKTVQGFRLLMENKYTQQRAIATVLGLLRKNQGVVAQCTMESKGWTCDNVVVEDLNYREVKETCLTLILNTLNHQLYQDKQFLSNKISYANYLDLQIEVRTDLQADEKSFYPLYQFFEYSIDMCPQLAVEILKKVKTLPTILIKKIIEGIRAQKLSPQVYNHLEFLSKNEQMKALFNQEFTQEKPPKIEIFAKLIKYQFAQVHYLKKMHEQALSFYTSDYNEFLNQIFSIYNSQDIKDIQAILIKYKHIHFQVIKYLYSLNRVLDKQPMGIILKMPHLLDFQTKKYLFRKHPKIRRASRYRIPIQVSRTNILQQSYNQIMSKTAKQLQGKLQVTFMDEQGYDAGGLTRQWLMCLSRQIFNPSYALFEPSSSGNTYQPNPKSYINPDHLQYFRFIGRFVAKALAQNELVDAYFTRAVYKTILGQQIQLSDLKEQDYSFYKSMLWLKENLVQEGDYTFSYLYDNFGHRIIKDLIPDGRNINVNQQNKLEYIQNYCFAKMRDDFKSQMEKFLQGFHQIIPNECISFFDPKQLQLLISGLPQVDFEDLKNNVDYSGFTPADQVIRWFWEIVQQFSQEDLAKLIQFITGTSKIPVGGFSSIKGMNGLQRISIHKDPNGHQLPKAHTCFNQLDLPNYGTKQILKQKVMIAITWGSEGFGFM